MRAIVSLDGVLTDSNGANRRMTKEKLLARRQEAEGARENALANAQRWYGVMADCDYWLEQLQEDSVAGQAKPEANQSTHQSATQKDETGSLAGNRILKSSRGS
jgi:hypothetical protein